jgi:phospholipid/cholesterol/gamma-HCH transport system substrate-binding protein
LTHNLGPGPIDRSETASAATPIGAQPGGDFGAQGYTRPLAGLAAVVGIGLIVALAAGLFRGSFTEIIPVTVISDRAGLVMNPDAKVKMRDIQVGKVSSIDSLPNGQAALHLAIDPAQMHLIPSNVFVDISSSTVFGAKSVELQSPPDPSPDPLQAGQTVQAQHVTVEVNTVFDRLTKVLSTIQPDKLNQTLGAIASALNDRGEKIGDTLTDLDHLLATVDPSMANLSHELSTAPEVLRAYGDAVPHLIATVEDATTISQTIVDEQKNLDAFLLSTIGLADAGNQVVGDNRQALTDVLHVIVPTTDLTNEYNTALTCALTGVIPLAKSAPPQYPGVFTLASFLWGAERYRYPQDLPKVAAKGGPHCQDVQMPDVPYEGRPPYMVADIGVNPFKYGNQGVLLNSAGIKQWLFGEIDGPPRNSAQIGQPG